MTPLMDMWEEHDYSAFEGCFEYDKVEYYQNKNIEGQVDIESNLNPQWRNKKSRSTEVKCSEAISMEG